MDDQENPTAGEIRRTWFTSARCANNAAGCVSACISEDRLPLRPSNYATPEVCQEGCDVTCEHLWGMQEMKKIQLILKYEERGSHQPVAKITPPAASLRALPRIG